MIFSAVDLSRKYYNIFTGAEKLLLKCSHVSVIIIGSNAVAALCDTCYNFLHKNCIVLREETEWMELIESKNNILTGTSKEKIIQAFKNRKSLNQDFSKPIYGTGKTAELIIKTLLNFKK